MIKGFNWENPLMWWKQNSFRFPRLSRMAKLYMSVPATSVPSERVFSTAGDILTASRATLSPQHVDQLIFLKKKFDWKGELIWIIRKTCGKASYVFLFYLRLFANCIFLKGTKCVRDNLMISFLCFCQTDVFLTPWGFSHNMW